ncbi:transglutaminase-like domain-containing protein [Agaribacter flavus]|uniref:Transglutaminase family protein n=1 Tax=Agaribacter flavus TaxID=1902781 RepID=A0ABV7FMR4_9ALTE
MKYCIYRLLAFSFITVSAITSAQTPSFLSNIPISIDENVKLPLDSKISITLITAKPKKLSQTLSDNFDIEPLTVNEQSVQLPLTKTYVHDRKQSSKHLQDSFIVDYTEPSASAFTKEFKDKYKETYQLSDLERYVSEYITETTYIHGFNIASVVADTRSGDCTEHAVLLAALARSLSIPAKIVFGTAIVEESDNLNAYGHAWVEVYQNDHWQLLDAALYGAIGSKIYYLPANELTNEGPGYAFGIAEIVGLLPQALHIMK